MEPSTQDLPFVLVHGPWIWKLALIAVVGGVLGIVIVVRRLFARAEVRRRLALLDHRREADGVIRGKLGGAIDGPLAATLSAIRVYDPDERAHWRADQLWVETAEGRVALAGNLTVELGSDGVAKRRRLPALPADLAAAARALPRVEDKTFGIAKVVTVTAGDDVVVRGRLERAPSGEDTGFRESAVAWTMHPASEDEPIRVAARRPRTVIARLSIVATLLVGGGTALVGYKVAGSLGERWRQQCWDRDRYKHVEGFVALDNADACLRTAATPGRQSRAYDALFYSLREHPHRDDRSLARLLELADRSDGCRGKLDILEQHGRFEDMVVHARRCKLPEREREALGALGRFAEAAQLVERPSLEHIYTLIAAERWADAAILADEQAQHYRRSESGASQESRDIAELYYKCVGELFRIHAGDQRALARLQNHEAGEHGQVCLPVLVEASPPDERAKLIARYDRQRSYAYDTRTALETQAFLDGTRYPYEYESAERALVRLDDPMGLSKVRLAWVARLANIDALTSPVHRASALRWLAISQVLDGKHELAMQTANTVTALAKTLDAEPLEMYPLAEVALLPASVALYTPQIVDVDLDTAGLESSDAETRAMRRESRLFRFGRLPLRAGRSLAGAYFGPDEQYVLALQTAQQGDGLMLAQYVATGRWWSDGDVIAVLPRIKTNRDKLAAQLPRSTNHTNWRYLRRPPFELASSAAVRRDLLRMIGDEPGAVRWDGVYQRVAKVMDRRRVMAYVLWDN